MSLSADLRARVEAGRRLSVTRSLVADYFQARAAYARAESDLNAAHATFEKAVRWLEHGTTDETLYDFDAALAMLEVSERGAAVARAAQSSAYAALLYHVGQDADLVELARRHRVPMALVNSRATWR